MQISNQNNITSLARQNILEKANQAFSGGERAEDFGIEIPFTKALNTLLDGFIDAEECCRRMVALH